MYIHIYIYLYPPPKAASYKCARVQYLNISSKFVVLFKKTKPKPTPHTHKGHPNLWELYKVAR